MNNKPISMVINETRISLLNICKESNLPACILEPILKDLHEEVKRVSAIQLQQDEESYMQAQKEAQNSKNEPVTEKDKLTEPS